MSVSPEKNSENIRDRGKPRYGSPTLRSSILYPLVSAVLTNQLPYEDRDPLLPLCPFLLLGWRAPSRPAPTIPPDATGAHPECRPRHSYLPYYRTGERQA